jgi:hypothetical protein
VPAGVRKFFAVSLSFCGANLALSINGMITGNDISADPFALMPQKSKNSRMAQ